MADMEPPASLPLDSAWLKQHPLPRHDDGVDKHGRGRVLVVGGCRRVPGGLLLTAEAGFRAGAGRVTIATIESAAMALGIAQPQCGVIALPETRDGEIADGAGAILLDAIDKHDAIVIGPAMANHDSAEDLLETLLPAIPVTKLLLLDAAALHCLPRHAGALIARDGATVMTPHAGEMAALLECDGEEIAADPVAALERAAHRYGSTIMAKGPVSHLMQGYTRLTYAGGGIGLAMAGSGDTLAGLIAALGAQGLPPFQAAAWGIWLHGEAGRRLAETMGPIGYMTHELLPLIPGLMRGV